MIGITTIKITSAEGIGFAIPINIVKPIIESFLKEGKFEEPYLGIYGYDDKVIPYLNSEINFSGGIYIASIDLNGPLKDKGIKVGDIITKIDDYELNTMSQLKRFVYMKKHGEEVTLTLKRDNETFTKKVKLGVKL